MSFSPDSRYVIGEYGALGNGHNGKVIEGMNAVYSGRGSLSVKSTVVWSRNGRSVAVIIGNGICLGTLPGAEFPDAEQEFLLPDFMPKEATEEPLALPAPIDADRRTLRQKNDPAQRTVLATDLTHRTSLVFGRVTEDRIVVDLHQLFLSRSISAIA